MLRHVGHESVSVLDGGFEAWTRDGGITTSSETVFEPVGFAARLRPGDTIDREELLSALGTMTLLDARAPERYEGVAEPIDPLAGHIPTAVSAYHGGNVREDGTMRSRDELLGRFNELGAQDRAVTYCGSGVTSCHNVLAMVVAGLPEPRLYPGSWSDWSGAAAGGDIRFVVETGPEPGAAR